MKALPKNKADGFKVGPNKLEQNRIRVLSDEGKDANEISLILKIKLESVKAWMPKKKKKATKEKES